jgi:predicted DNA-binding transcriptional regulator AlpA
VCVAYFLSETDNRGIEQVNTVTNEIRTYPDGRLSAKDAATYTGLSQYTLANLRMNGKGPRFVKIGRVFYFQKDLDEWIQEGVAQSTAEARSKKGLTG